jgi:uncharacterized membrane protein YfcA
MTFAEALLILLAGLAAGTINTVVGSGTLITFPVLLALGYAPVVANMSNNIGLVPGGVSGTIGYRRELAGQRQRIIRFGALSVVGAAIGATLLLTLPSAAFRAIVPAFIAVALLLIVFQRRVSEFVERRRTAHDPHGGPGVLAGVFAGGVYGGYFGAAQGILLLSLFGVTIKDSLQRLNALKNLLALLNNATAAIAFVVFGHIAWDVVGLIAAGSIVGGQIGSRAGRRLPDRALRAFIVVVGCFAIARLIAG